MLIKLVAGVLMLGILVFIHELGHFVVAKAFGVGVPVFSFGMGPRLAGFRWRGTDYRLSAIPVGGYVRLSGADPFGEEDPDELIEPERDFMQKPVWQRFLVMLAGPAFNLALPLVLFTGVLMLGEPHPDSSVGTVFEGTPAERAGIEPGDRVVAVDGKPVETWIELVEALRDRAGQPVELSLDRGGRSLSATLPAGAVELTAGGLLDTQAVGLWSSRRSTRIGVDGPDAPAARAGLEIGDAIVAVDGEEVQTWEQLQGRLRRGDRHEIRYLRGEEGGRVVEGTAVLEAPLYRVPRPGDPLADRYGLVPALAYVGRVAEGSPAEAAGVKEEDRLLAVDGVALVEWTDLFDLVEATVDDLEPGQTPRPLDLTLVRGGEVITLHFAPRMEREVLGATVRYRPIMGIVQYPEAYTPGPTVQVYYPPLEAVPRAVEETGYLFSQTMRILGSLFTGEIRPQESLGGPIEIFRMAGEGMERGLYAFIRLVGTISISLGIINLLPVPVLDGGQIMFYLVEMVRGRPLSLAFRERMQMIGVLALVALMLMVAVFDVNRWLSGG